MTEWEYGNEREWGMGIETGWNGKVSELGMGMETR